MILTSLSHLFFSGFTLKTVYNSTSKFISTLSMLGSDRLVWIDLEMTGLDVEKHTILELACIVTKPDLKFLHEGFNIVIHHPEPVLESMSDWCKTEFSKTGLTELSRNSKISLEEAEEKTYNYIKQFTTPDGNNHICGNSVYMDKRFLEKYMPKVNSLFHYRILDVSSLSILCKNWYPEEFEKFSKKNEHKALLDIQESINQLRYYKNVMFKEKPL